MKCRKRAYPSLERIGHPIDLYLDGKDAESKSN